MNTKAIKEQIKSVNKIQKITKTMEMVSIAKSKKLIPFLEASREFSSRAIDILSSIPKSPNNIFGATNHGNSTIGKSSTDNNSQESESTNNNHKDKKLLMIIIASSKGMCGPYNNNLYKELINYIKSQQISPSNIDVVAIRKFATRISAKASLNTIKIFDGIQDNPDVCNTSDICNFVLSEFNTKKYKQVSILYTKAVKSSVSKPEIKQIIPLNITEYGKVRESNSPETDAKYHSVAYTIEPNLEYLIETTASALIESIIHQALIESAISEHNSRMIAMKSASDNASDLIQDLKLSYNKARQEKITREIAEISAGAEAV